MNKVNKSLIVDDADGDEFQQC